MAGFPYEFHRGSYDIEKGVNSASTGQGGGGSLCATGGPCTTRSPAKAKIPHVGWYQRFPDAFDVHPVKGKKEPQRRCLKKGVVSSGLRKRRGDDLLASDVTRECRRKIC